MNNSEKNTIFNEHPVPSELVETRFLFDTKQAHAAGVTVKCEGGSEGGRG